MLPIEQVRQLATDDLIIKPVRPKAFVFDDKALLKCFYCEKYGKNFRCPPNIPRLDYRSLIYECLHGLLFCYKQKFSDKITDLDRRISSQTLHEAVLQAEKILWDNNTPLAVSFIGGSCKLCGPECPGEDCEQPQNSRIPLEAAGVNIAKTAMKAGVHIVYPPKEYFWRVGAVLW